MSISNPIARNDYVGNGATITWSYGFKVFAESDLAVVSYSSVTGLFTALVLNLDYTVTGVGNDTGGSITQIIGFSIPAILPATSTLSIVRGMAFTQPAVLNNQGLFYPKTIEDAFDRLTMLLQQMNDTLNRSVKLPLTEAPTSLNSTLPTVTQRVNKYFGWNSLGDIISVASAAPSTLVSAFWNTILGLTTSLASRTALGTKEIVYAIDSGVSPNHVLSGANIAIAGFVAPTAYLDGDRYTFKAAFASAASVTLNVNGLGAKGILKKGADTSFGTSLYLALQLREYSVNEYITVQYNIGLDKFVIISNLFGMDSQISYGTTAGSGGTAYVTTGIRRIFGVAVPSGNIFAFKADVANAGACTLSINGGTALPLKIAVFGVTQDPPAGLFSANDVVQVVSDGTNYVILQDTAVRKLVSVTNVTAVANTGNIALVAGQKYSVEFQANQNTAAGRLDLRFNADAGALYKWITVTESSGAGPVAGNGANAATEIRLSGADLVAVGSSIAGSFEFTPKTADSTIGNLSHRLSYLTGANLQGTTGAGYYDGAANITSFQLLTSAGTFTGKILVYAIPS